VKDTVFPRDTIIRSLLPGLLISFSGGRGGRVGGEDQGAKGAEGGS
jgi:hypothetical protein